LGIPSLAEGVVDILSCGEGAELKGAGDCSLLKPVVGVVVGSIGGNELIGADPSLSLLIKNFVSTVCSFVFAADGVAGSTEEGVGLSCELISTPSLSKFTTVVSSPFFAASCKSIL
jgi:hypothetical protein